MKPSEVAQVRLSSATDKISQESQVEPQVTKITRKVITTTQPVTQTYITKKVITTTTRSSKPNVIQNTRYNNISSSTSSKPNTSNYSRPVVKCNGNFGLWMIMMCQCKSAVITHVLFCWEMLRCMPTPV